MIVTSFVGRFSIRRRIAVAISSGLLIAANAIGLYGQVGSTDAPATGTASSGLNSNAIRPEADAADMRAKNIESFEYVWSTVRDRHWDPSLNGIDWQQVHDTFKPQVESAKDRDSVDRLLNEMLATLEQSHFGIIPASAYTPLDAHAAPSDGSIGVEVRMVDGHPTVWRIHPNSPAERAGIKPGWVLQAVGEQETSLIINKVLHSEVARIDRSLLALLVCQRTLNGPIGQSNSFRWLNEAEDEVTLDVSFEAHRGKSAKFGNMPPLVVRCETTNACDRVPCFSLSMFFDPPYVLPIYEKWIEDNRSAAGLIIDLRGNPGGLGVMSMSLGGFLVSEAGGYLGTMTTRQGSLKFTLQPRNVVFAGKVAVLVDELSMSTSEILAGGLQDIGRVRVFGTKTPGMALPSNLERLPNGSGFQYAFANYTSANGLALEARGVVPDQPVSLTRKALLEGRDEVLESAVQWIEGGE